METKYVKGTELNASAQAEALRRFVHRWTHENARQTYGGRCPGCEQSSGRYGNGSMTREQWHAHHVPLITDAEWLKTHKFAVNKDGTLNRRVSACVSA